jgi:quinol monooxygenase YgiN
MYIVNVTIFVKPEFAAKFIEATIDNASNTRHEHGNIRFDVCQAEDDPNRFLLYEAYKTKEDFAAHQQTAHYARWRDAVTPWMAQPRTSVKHFPLFFDNARV